MQAWKGFLRSLCSHHHLRGTSQMESSLSTLDRCSPLRHARAWARSVSACDPCPTVLSQCCSSPARTAWRSPRSRVCCSSRLNMPKYNPGGPGSKGGRQGRWGGLTECAGGRIRGVPLTGDLQWATPQRWFGCCCRLPDGARPHPARMTHSPPVLPVGWVEFPRRWGDVGWQGWLKAVSQRRSRGQ